MISDYGRGDEAETLRSMRPGCWMSLLTVVNKSGLSPRQAAAALDRLASRGLVEIDEQPGRSFYRRRS